MRNRKFDKLLREAIILDAEEQGRMLFSDAEPIPEAAQMRFDAALNGARKESKRTIDAAPQETPQPVRRAHRWLAYGLSVISVATLVLVVAFMVGRSGERGMIKSEEPEVSLSTNAPLAPDQSDMPMIVDATCQPNETAAPVQPVESVEPEPTETPKPEDLLVGTWILKAMEHEDESQSGQIAIINAMIAAGKYEVTYTFLADGSGLAYWDIQGEKTAQAFTYTVDGDQLTFSNETMAFEIDGDRMKCVELGITMHFERRAEDFTETQGTAESDKITEAELVGTWTLTKIGDGNGSTDGSKDLDSYDPFAGMTSEFIFAADGSVTWTLKTAYSENNGQEQRFDTYTVSDNVLHFFIDGTETPLSTFDVIYDPMNRTIRLPIMNVGALIYVRESEPA